LVAEDNELSASLLEKLLARREHEVTLARNGRDALALAAGGGFDLLLLDVHMPELDGFQVVGAIRERERAAGGHLPVVALTARSRKEDRERCLAAGMDEFLPKPIKADDLYAAIDRLGRKGEGERIKEEPRRTSASGSSRVSDPSPTGGGLLDPRAVLAACKGDAAILDGICRVFRASLPGQLGAVRAALQDGDAGRLREAAHRLCATIGAFSTVAGGLASDIEDRAEAGQLDEARLLVERLEAMASQLLPVVGGLSVDTLRQRAAGANPSARQ
jgi:CheY-like chemotaxis protein